MRLKLKQWPTMLEVQQDILGLYGDLEEVKKVKNKNGIGISQG